MVDEVQERLAEVNRSFPEAAVVSHFPHLWASALPAARHTPDDELLDLVPDSLDLVVHAMGLHWHDDPLGQLIQARRALRPDGLVLAACFGGQTLHELRTAMAEAETQIRGGLSPRVLPMAEIRDYGALLGRAGLALPVADSVTTVVEYRDLRHLMRDLRDMGETNALFQRARTPLRRDVLERAEDIYRRAFAAPSGRLRATFEVIYLTGWRPDATQQQPLRPGSARGRLSDALGVEEFQLPTREPGSND